MENANIPVAFWAAKLKHSGITGFLQYTSKRTRMSSASLENLKGYLRSTLEDPELIVEPPSRELNEIQSRKLKSYCQKLAYYSATRQFHSRKTGKKHKFKVAMLTLTAPESAKFDQILKAFDGFLDYLRRTANCVYVWKKELGETGDKLHFHILINNFIPYYIVSWKWKRLLINQGVNWPLTPEGVHTDSHYRIELPRNKRQTAAYISKYLSKAHYLPSNLGYIAGKSKVLDDCKEIQLMPGEYSYNEIYALSTIAYTIYEEYYTHICVDLAHVKKIAPRIHALFKDQLVDFFNKLSMPQKFDYV